MSERRICNICESVQFVDIQSRKNARCAKCGSMERTRAMKLILDVCQILKPGMRVMHLAPEAGLARYFQKAVGAGYEAFDYDPALFPGMPVKKLDLVMDLEGLSSESYDLVIHSHVMEHLPCNITAVLFHLHRLIKPDGHHIFSFPIFGGKYASDFANLSGPERKARFGQDDHVRRFGRDDIDLTVGKIFNLRTYDLEVLAGRNLLELHAIPEEAWRGFTSHTIFVQRKNDLRLTL